LTKKGVAKDVELRGDNTLSISFVPGDLHAILLSILAASETII
jgi:hypothetical protein